jgi:hypothetical protein
MTDIPEFDPITGQIVQPKANPAHREVKVTIRDRPTDHLIRDALKETVVSDARGRRIRLTRPSALAQYKIVQVMGGDSSSNATYVQMVLPLLFVSAIDDDPVFFPAKAIEIDALIQRLDEDGIAAVMKGVSENFAKEDPEAERDAIKN